MSDRTPIRDRLAIAREMTSSMDTLTAAGQRFMMEKLVAFLEKEFPRCFVTVQRRRRDVITQRLQQLASEATRLAPDPQTFTCRARSLIEAYAAAV